MSSRRLPLRYLAPAGAPIRVSDLARWAGNVIGTHDAGASLVDVIRTRFGVKHVFLTCTARAGLTVLLRAMRRLAGSDRNEVIIPAYTCFSVAASIVKAGLRPRLVDVSPLTLDYIPAELEAVDGSRALAILATNLYGLPNNVPLIERVARRHGAFVVDDAAQAMGASVAGRLSGTSGDAGLFSLDKGKNVSAIDGGVVLTSSPDIAASLREEVRGLQPPPLRESLSGVVKAIAYSLMLRPRLYWIPNRIPQLELGKTVFTTDFPIGRPSPALVALARTMIGRLDAFTHVRQTNAAALLDRLAGISRIEQVVPAPASVPVYLRLPVLLPDAAARVGALEALNRAGIGASCSYPSSLGDVRELSPLLAGPTAMAGARDLAQRILTLPTHGFVQPSDIDAIGRLLADVLTHGSSPRPKGATCAA